MWSGGCEDDGEDTDACAFDGSTPQDPDDGNMYTYKEVLTRFKAEGFSEGEIKDYWREDCKVIKDVNPLTATTPAEGDSTLVTDPDSVTFFVPGSGAS